MILRLRESQHQQIALARHHGIDAFCFHYYWFAGQRLLEKPILDFLADPAANIEFCLCWANENWTRGWDASEQEILMPQTYSPENDVRFIESVIPFFRDPRNLRVNGAPVLVVYRPQHLPDASATAAVWRQHCREAGIGEIHLVAALTHGNRDFEQFGFDAGVEFPPHNSEPGVNIYLRNLRQAIAAGAPSEGTIWSYFEIAESYLQRDYGLRRVYRTVFPSWDNTARRGEGALVCLGASPENYERWLEGASHRTISERPPGERLVFINAWNEWAEGCHLEPDMRHGRAFLEATLRVKNGQSVVSPDWPTEADLLRPFKPDPAALADPHEELEGIRKDRDDLRQKLTTSFAELTAARENLSMVCEERDALQWYVSRSAEWAARIEVLEAKVERRKNPIRRVLAETKRFLRRLGIFPKKFGAHAQTFTSADERQATLASTTLEDGERHVGRSLKEPETKACSDKP